MSSVNEQFLVNTLIIAIGWLVRRYLVGDAGSTVLVKVVLNVTLPALIVSTFAGVRVEPSLVVLPIIALAYGLLMVGLGGFLLFRHWPRKRRGQVAFILPTFNIGLFAYPLVEGALGRGALKYLGMFDVGVAVMVFVVLLVVASYFAREDGDRPGAARILRAMTRSVPLIVYVLTVVLAVVDLRYPGPVVSVANVLARANMPLVLLVLGMFLRFDAATGRWGEVALLLGIRYAVGIAVGVALYMTLPYDQTFRTVLLVVFLLPPPLITLAYAVEFEYDAPFVGLFLNVANIVSYFALWVAFNVVGHPHAGSGLPGVTP
jgi:predicted permease